MTIHSEEEIEQLDFARRCTRLDENITMILDSVESERVKVAVLTRMIVQIAYKCDNPEKALLQVIRSLADFNSHKRLCE
jgi:hypothetical protein